MRTILSVFIILICVTTIAQNTFVKSVAWYDNAFGLGIERTGTSGYVILGAKSDPNPFDTDPFLAKVDLNGDTVWTRHLGNNDWESPFDLISTADGGFAMTGRGGYNSQSGAIVMLIKFDSSGIIEWSRAYGGLSTSYTDEGNKLIQTSDGGFMIAGITMEFGPYPGESDLYLLRTDAQGNLLWTRAYGGQYHDEPTGLDSTIDGGFIISGRTDSYSTSTLENDAFLMRVDSNGNVIWYKRYGGTGYEWGKCVHSLPNGDFILTGDETSYHATQGYGAFIMRLNSAGNVIWAKSYSQFNKHVVIFGSMLTSDNGIIATGYFESWAGDRNILNLRLDSTGTIIWQKHLGGNRDELCYDIALAPDSGFVFIGTTNGLTGPGPSQAIILKSDLSGNHGCYDSITNLTVTNANVNPVAITVQQYTGGTGDTVNYPEFSGMGKYLFCENNVSVEDRTANTIGVYPNPATDNITVVSLGYVATTLEIYTIDGKLLLTESFAGEKTFDISGFSSGMYLLRVTNGEIFYSKRIVKE